MAFLDNTGLTYLVNKIKNVFAPKANPEFTGSISMGRMPNTTVGNGSVAEGQRTTASGASSHAEGDSTVASEAGSHAEGLRTTASGITSHSEGSVTTASGSYSHAEGNSTVASGASSHAEGQGSASTGATGEASHAEGHETTASGNRSHAEGNVTVASGTVSHAEGNATVASGIGSHAEGLNTAASGIASHSEGSGTKAYHDYSHAGGLRNYPGYREDQVFDISSYSDDDSVGLIIGDLIKNESDYYIVKQSFGGTKGSLLADASTYLTELSDDDRNRHYLETIGNKDSSQGIGNARSLDMQGNEYLNGDLFLNCDGYGRNGVSVSNSINSLQEKNNAAIYRDLASQSDLESTLLTLCSTMAVGQIKSIRFGFAASPSSGFFKGKSGHFIGQVKKNTDNRCVVDVQNAGNSTQQGEQITGLYNGTTWIWHDLYDEAVLKTAVVNNLTTENSGYVLDARSGKTLDDKIALLSPFSGKNIANNFTTENAGYVLDARAGKILNDKIEKFTAQNLGSLASQSALQAALVTLGATMSALQSIVVRFSFTTSPDSGVFKGKGGYYIGYFKCITTNAYILDVQNGGTGYREGEHITGTYNGTEWTWHDLSDEIDSKINILSTGSVTTFTLTIPASSHHFIIVSTNNAIGRYCGVVATVTNTVQTIDLSTGSAFTIDTATENKMKFTSTLSARSYYICDICFHGDPVSI